MPKIEVEVRNKAELLEATACDIDVIMLDNMTPTQIKELASLVPKHIKTEASGGINLSNIADFRGCGVDYISIGSLTHSVTAFDILFLLFGPN